MPTLATSIQHNAGSTILSFICSKVSFEGRSINVSAWWGEWGEKGKGLKKKKILSCPHKDNYYTHPKSEAQRHYNGESEEKVHENKWLYLLFPLFLL